MEKINKQNEIKRMLSENLSAKEISEKLKTNIAYVYKIKKQEIKSKIDSLNLINV